MGCFQSHASKVGGDIEFFFFIGASTTKKFARSRIYRYGSLKIF